VVTFFLIVTVSEDLMILIIEDVLYYDAFMQCEFTFYAYIIAWISDISALSKVMNITGYNLYLDYRFYNI